MEIEYTNTTEDALAYTLFMSKSSPYLQGQKRRSRLIYSFAIAVFYFAIDSMLKFQIKWSTVIVSLLFGVISYLVYPLLTEYNVRKTLPKLLSEDKYKGTTGRIKVIITKEGLQNFTDSFEGKTYSGAVIKMGLTKDHVFIVSPSPIYSIPRHAFSSDEQRSSFIELIKSNYHDSTGEELPVVSY